MLSLGNPDPGTETKTISKPGDMMPVFDATYEAGRKCNEPFDAIYGAEPQKSAGRVSVAA
jgi:hypothetical protein